MIPPRTAHITSKKPTPSAAAANVPACVNAVNTMKQHATVHRRAGCPDVPLDRSAHHVATYVAHINAMASDCFSKSPIMRTSGGLKMAIVVAAMAPSTARRAPRLKIHAATKIAMAANGSPAVSTTRDAHKVAVSISQPVSTIAHLASTASIANRNGTSVHSNRPCSSNARA